MPDQTKQTDYNVDILADECRAITRYLLEQDPPQDLIGRYIEANAIIFSDEVSVPDGGDTPICRCLYPRVLFHPPVPLADGRMRYFQHG